ncbi:MAG: sigma-70 family RNA polymerase sigma factor [Oscillospiraceae bacterium]|nr:sigma-70 family RNA polymerase sigma factor [Oscillospiraceae bacterium]
MTAYMPYIRKRANAAAGGGLESDDLVQEGLIGLFQALETYDDTQDASFSTYAITCINNGMNAALRKAARKKQQPLRGYYSLSAQDADTLPDAASVEELAIAKEAYAAVQQKIRDHLSDFERDVLALYLLGYDYNALAARLDTTPKSVDNALQRARKKLK